MQDIIMPISHKIRSRAFRDWFGMSKVIDLDGNPLRVFHATNKDFTSFSNTVDIGFHFGTAAQAEKRALDKGYDRTLAFYLSIKNPIIMPDLGDWDFWRFTEDGMAQACKPDAKGVNTRIFSDEEIEYVAESLSYSASEQAGWEFMRAYFESKGADGIRYINIGETADGQAGEYSYVAFRPNQIKLANGLNLTYDRESPEFTL